MHYCLEKNNQWAPESWTYCLPLFVVCQLSNTDNTILNRRLNRQGDHYVYLVSHCFHVRSGVMFHIKSDSWLFYISIESPLLWSSNLKLVFFMLSNSLWTKRQACDACHTDLILLKWNTTSSHIASSLYFCLCNYLIKSPAWLLCEMDPWEQQLGRYTDLSLPGCHITVGLSDTTTTLCLF